jgi:hypothetical protein
MSVCVDKNNFELIVYCSPAKELVLSSLGVSVRVLILKWLSLIATHLIFQGIVVALGRRL